MSFERYKNVLPKSELKIKGLWQKGNRVETALELDGKTWQVYFESDDYALEPAWEALLPLALMAGMRHASSLRVGHAIDAVLLEHLHVFQQRLSATDPGFSVIPIEEAPPAAASPDHPGRVGLFFSGGMDSWYSLLDRLDEVTDLVFVCGVDIPLENSAHLQKSIDLAKRVSDRYGKNLVTMRTNLRSFTDRFLPWHIYLDSLMQSPAYLLKRDFSNIYLASALTTENLRRYGLDPSLTDLWSGSSLQVVYDSMEVNRIQKTARVAQEAFALQNLRVCWQNPVEGLNCGVCEKCLRTMVNLEAAGALERCPVFNRPLDLKLVARDFIKDDNQLFNAQMNLEAVTLRQGNSPLARALRHSIRSSVYKRWMEKRREAFKGYIRRVRRLLKGRSYYPRQRRG